MLVRVEYKDGVQELVTPAYLDHLLNLFLIRRFMRAGQWVDPAREPIRRLYPQPYRGLERRCESGDFLTEERFREREGRKHVDSSHVS